MVKKRGRLRATYTEQECPELNSLLSPRVPLTPDELIEVLEEVKRKYGADVCLHFSSEYDRNVGVEVLVTTYK